MKKLVLILSLVLLMYGTAAAQNLTTDEWVKDLQYLENIIQKQFVSFDPSVKPIFNKEMDQLKSNIGTLKNHEVSCEIMRLLSLLKDGHTELNVGHKNVGFHRLPILAYFFGESLYIIAAHKNYENLVGKEIAYFNDFSTKGVFRTLQKRMSADNNMEYYHAAPGYLILTELLECIGVSEDPMEATLTVGDEKVVIRGIPRTEYNAGEWSTMYSLNSIERPLYLSVSGKYYWHQFLETESVMYFNFTRVNNQKGEESIKKYVKRLFKEIDDLRPEKLIIDFRLNNGGNYGLSRPLVEAIVKRPWLNQSGKLWVINGRRTFSAASVASIYLKDETEAILIGEPGRTHPNWADNNEYLNLPGSNFLIEYTTRIKQHWPAYPNLDRVPVDVFLPPNYSAYKKGEDIVMSYILEN